MAAVLALTGAAPEPAPAAAPASCSAHGVAYRKGAIRVFLRGSRTRTYYLCSATLRTPRAYHVRRVTDSEDVPYDYVVKGRRLSDSSFSQSIVPGHARDCDFGEAAPSQAVSSTIVAIRAVLSETLCMKLAERDG